MLPKLKPEQTPPPFYQTAAISKSFPASEAPNARTHSRSRRERARRTRNPKSTRETRNRKKTKRTNSKKSKRRRKKSPETPKSAVKSEPRLIKRRTEARKPGPEIHPPARGCRRPYVVRIGPGRGRWRRIGDHEWGARETLGREAEGWSGRAVGVGVSAEGGLSSAVTEWGWDTVREE